MVCTCTADCQKLGSDNQWASAFKVCPNRVAPPLKPSLQKLTAYCNHDNFLESSVSKPGIHCNCCGWLMPQNVPSKQCLSCKQDFCVTCSNSRDNCMLHMGLGGDRTDNARVDVNTTNADLLRKTLSNNSSSVPCMRSTSSGTGTVQERAARQSNFDFVSYLWRWFDRSVSNGTYETVDKVTSSYFSQEVQNKVLKLCRVPHSLSNLATKLGWSSADTLELVRHMSQDNSNTFGVYDAATSVNFGGQSSASSSASNTASPQFQVFPSNHAVNQLLTHHALICTTLATHSHPKDTKPNIISGGRNVGNEIKQNNFSALYDELQSSWVQTEHNT